MAFHETVEYFLAKYNLDFEVRDSSTYYASKLGIYITCFGENYLIYSYLFKVDSWDGDIFNKIAVMQITRFNIDPTRISVDDKDNLVLSYLITELNVSKFLFEKCIEQFLDAQSFWLKTRPSNNSIS